MCGVCPPALFLDRRRRRALVSGFPGWDRVLSSRHRPDLQPLKRLSQKCPKAGLWPKSGHHLNRKSCERPLLGDSRKRFSWAALGGRVLRQPVEGWTTGLCSATRTRSQPGDPETAAVRRQPPSCGPTHYEPMKTGLSRGQREGDGLAPISPLSSDSAGITHRPSGESARVK